MVHKENIFKRIKRWWKEELCEDERTWLKIVGIWTVDGIMLGTAVTGAVKNHQIKRIAKTERAKGYLEGTLDTYREIVQNPYIQMDNGMRKLEQTGKAKKF